LTNFTENHDRIADVLEECDLNYDNDLLLLLPQKLERLVIAYSTCRQLFENKARETLPTISSFFEDEEKAKKFNSAVNRIKELFKPYTETLLVFRNLHEILLLVYCMASFTTDFERLKVIKREGLKSESRLFVLCQCYDLLSDGMALFKNELTKCRHNISSGKGLFAAFMAMPRPDRLQDGCLFDMKGIKCFFLIA